MKNYYGALHQNEFDSLPVTFHIKSGVEDLEWEKFKEYYNKDMEEVEDEKGNVNESKKKKEEKKIEGTVKDDKKVEGAAEIESDNDDDKKKMKISIWIIKPGENTNRGNGINVCSELNEITNLINKDNSVTARTYILQKYIDRPLLIFKRKFDMRCYAMTTCVNGCIKGYSYQEGYLRTSSKEFSITNLNNKLIHLTNDAIQKKSDDYGKFENANKLSYKDFQKYIDTHMAEQKVNIYRDILPQIKKLITDTMRAVYGKIDPHKRLNTFEIYGYDFMLDEDFKVYLIEVNTNPCLELAGPILSNIIPAMVDNAFRIAIDPIFPPPPEFTSNKKNIVNDIIPENKFELVFDENVDGPGLKSLMKEHENIIIEIDEDEEGSGDEDDESTGM